MSHPLYPSRHEDRMRAIIRLALPVIGARVGILTMATMDTLMLGHAGANELAYFAISAAPQVTLLTVSLGLLAGTQVLCAQARGARELERVGQIWRVAMVIAVVLGLAGAALLWQGKALLRLAAQSADIVEGGGYALEMVAPGVPGLLMYIATALTLESIGRPRAGLIIVLAANGVKLLLNWLLIFGPFGLPELGAAGANLATAIVRWLMCIVIVAYLLEMSGAEAYGIYARIREPVLTAWRLLRLGAPIGLGQGLESSAFTTLAGFAGLIGATQLASYQIALNLTALLFMVSTGLATATAVHVAIAVGRGDRAGMAASGWLGTALNTAIMAVAALALAAGGGALAALYTSDPGLAAATIPVIAVVAWMVVPDGVQGVLMGALRGAGDVLMPTLLHLFSFWALTVPLAWHLAFTRGLGVEGLLWALVVGLSVAGAVLALRLLQIGRRAPSRH
ncbi:MAG: MATE family efflux transporter [Proteobacteria bacterium]|nr:MATE family efflux transporter [Pseudomonadota bacterium]MBI3499144.1 MATE family efflux transporter [Pseudomonadota bacterium]